MWCAPTGSPSRCWAAWARSLFNTLIYVGLQYTAATNGVLFNSVSPILIILLSWLAFAGAHLGAAGAGFVLSLAGVMAIVARGDLQLLWQRFISIAATCG